MSDVPASSYDGMLERTADGGVIRFERHLPYPIGNCSVVGLHTSLARLAPCLAGRPVAWDWDDFAEAQAHYASIGLAPPIDGP